MTDHENQERHEAVYDNDEKHGERPNGFVGKKETGEEMAQQVHLIELSHRYSLN